MTRSLFIGTLAGIALSMTAPAANAATLGVFTHVYGNGTGQVKPIGTDKLADGYVVISDQSQVSFADSFDLSSFSVGSIVSLSLKLVYLNAGNPANRMWNVAVAGTDAASMADDLTAQLTGQRSPRTITLAASTDTAGISAFARSIAMKALSFRFFETTDGPDAFKLNSAELTVTGADAPLPSAPPLPSVVPLPAGGLLLLGALAGLAALRRRKAR